MAGLGTIGVADALKDFLAARFPDFYVYRTYLGYDSADETNAENVGKRARIAVVPESFSFDPASRGRLARQVVCRVVVLKNFDASTVDETTFAPAVECDPLVGTLEAIAELFTERVVVAKRTGENGSDAEAVLYVPETRFSTDSPLYDEESLTRGTFLGALRVAVYEKIARREETR
ncbi:MAG: hypothetical protein IKK39_16515 [Thermoguttaceae bacterium]|nr:hypothetical protein [Thermoguttaceae bacterium]MBR4105647.1 hypothetical protein [Thermoguttaceae bacterium]